MKLHVKIFTIAIVCNFAFMASINADEYIIHACHGRIKVGDTYAFKGMKFSDKVKITWPKNDKDAFLKLRNITRGCWEERPPHDKAPDEGVILAGKGAEQILQDTLPMIDSLFFDLRETDMNAIRFKAHWIGKDYKDKYVTLPYSKGQNELYITREMLDIPIGETRDIEILVWKEDENEGVLWKEIIVEVVPLIKIE